MGVVSRLLIASPGHRLIETHYVNNVLYVYPRYLVMSKPYREYMRNCKNVLAFMQMLQNTYA